VTFFLDANVFVYAATPSDYREPCMEILAAVAHGAVDGRTSTAVVEEVWHLELSGRVGDLDGLARQTFTVMTPLLAVTDEIVGVALGLEAAALGANDRIHAATCITHGIERLVSADTDFDGLGPRLGRVDPLDRRALDRLLA